ncbi:MAG: Mor transcription activator family protein [Lachnospirales bacterium]
MDKNKIIYIGEKYTGYIKLNYKDTMEYFGSSVVYDICTYFNGTQIYVPSVQCVFTGAIEQFIIENYHLYTTAQLSRQFNIPTRKIYKIISNK